MKAKNALAYLTQVNDDSWISTCLLCAFACVLCIPFATLQWWVIPALVLGMLYEQLIEWLAHGWLQHYECRAFAFFVWRHARHHEQPQIHHALQPLVIFVPVTTMILIPCIILILFGSPILRSFAAWMIIGFLLTHIALNIEHYDIHMRHKILPRFVRRSRYYKTVVYYHIKHHNDYSQLPLAADTLRVYGISNPWLDILLYRIGATQVVDYIVPSLVSWLEKTLRVDTTKWVKTSSS